MLAGVLSRAAAEGTREDTRLRRLRWPATSAAAAIVVFWCGLREARAMIVQSDGASIALQAHAMLHGNLLLHGWYVADVSFYTTELPEYMLAEAVRGLTPGVLHICAALTYTLLVLLAAFVARGQARGREGLIRVAVTVAIMLGPSLAAANTLLNIPDHAGTAVPALLALALIDRGGRRRWVPCAVAVVLGWTLAGDPLILLIGVAPLLLVCGGRAVRLLVQRRLPLAAAWYELALAGAAVAALAIGSVISRAIRTLGGFTLGRGVDHFVLATTMVKNAWGLVADFLGLFSANFFGERFGIGLVVTGVHLVAAVLVAASVAVALRRFFSWGDDLVMPLLATAVAVNVAAFAVTYQVAASTMREIAPVFALGAALAGRMVAGPLLRNRLELLVIPAVAAALCAAVPRVLLPGPPPPGVSRLAAWLDQRHLSQGIAGYWDANSVSLDSGGRVTMRPVKAAGTPALTPVKWELDAPLLDSRAYDVDFLVASTTPEAGGTQVTEQDGINEFGRPDQTYRLEHWVIMVWRKNLLTDLARR